MLFLGVLILTDEEVQDTMDKISRMKVAELKDTCRALNERITGKKADLFNRVVSGFMLLRSSPDPAQQLAVRALVLKRCQGQDLPSFQDLYDAIRLGLFRIPAANTYAPHINSSAPSPSTHADSHFITIRKPPSSGSGSLAHRSHSLYFEESPFYRLVRLVHGTPQPCLPHHSRGACTISFTFLAEELRLFEQAQTPNSNLKVYLLSGRQAGASLSSTKVQIEYPLPLEIKVNSVVVAQNFKGIKGKVGTAKPADITLLLNGKDAYNRIQIVYAQTTERYLVYVYFVERVACESIIEEIIARPRIIKAATIRKVCAENEEEDDLVVSTSRVTLRDPLSYTRMKYPVQSLYCKHIQCFDGLIYLELQLQVPTWTCPICQEKIKVQDLAILEYFQDILDTVDDDTEQVQINQDGSWLQIDESKERKVPEARVEIKQPIEAKSVEPVVEVISLDSDLEEEPDTVERPPLPPPSVPPPSVPPPSSHERPVTQVLSLPAEQDHHTNPLRVDSENVSTRLLQRRIPSSDSENTGDESASLQDSASNTHSVRRASHESSSPPAINTNSSSAPLPPPLVPPPAQFRGEPTQDPESGNGRPSPSFRRVDFEENAGQARAETPNAQPSSQRNSIESASLSTKATKKSSLVDSAAIAEHMHKVASERRAQYERLLAQRKNAQAAPTHASENTGQASSPRPAPPQNGHDSNLADRETRDSFINSFRDGPQLSSGTPATLQGSERGNQLPRLVPLHRPQEDCAVARDGPTSDQPVGTPCNKNSSKSRSEVAVSPPAERADSFSSKSQKSKSDQVRDTDHVEPRIPQHTPHTENTAPSYTSASGQKQFSHSPLKPTTAATTPHTLHDHAGARCPSSIGFSEQVSGASHPRFTPIRPSPDQQRQAVYNYDTSSRNNLHQQPTLNPCGEPIKLPSLSRVPSLRQAGTLQKRVPVASPTLSQTGEPIETVTVQSSLSTALIGQAASPDSASSHRNWSSDVLLLQTGSHGAPKAWSPRALGERLLPRDSHNYRRADQDQQMLTGARPTGYGKGPVNTPIPYAPSGHGGSSFRPEYGQLGLLPIESHFLSRQISERGVVGNELVPMPESNIEAFDAEQINHMKDQVITNLRALKRDAATMAKRHQQQSEEMSRVYLEKLHQLVTARDADIVHLVKEVEMGRLWEQIAADSLNGSFSVARLREVLVNRIDTNQRTATRHLELGQANEKTLLQMAWHEQVDRFNRLYVRASEMLNIQGQFTQSASASINENALVGLHPATAGAMMFHRLPMQSSPSQVLNVAGASFNLPEGLVRSFSDHVMTVGKPSSPEGLIRTVSDHGTTAGKPPSTEGLTISAHDFGGKTQTENTGTDKSSGNHAANSLTNLPSQHAESSKTQNAKPVDMVSDHVTAVEKLPLGTDSVASTLNGATAKPSSQSSQLLPRGAGEKNSADCESPVEVVCAPRSISQRDAGSVSAGGMLTPANEGDFRGGELAETAGTGQPRFKEKEPQNPGARLGNGEQSLHPPRATINNLEGAHASQLPVGGETRASRNLEITKQSTDVVDDGTKQASDQLSNFVTNNESRSPCGQDLLKPQTANGAPEIQPRNVHKKQALPEILNMAYSLHSERRESPTLFLDSDAPTTGSGVDSPATPPIFNSAECSKNESIRNRSDQAEINSKGHKRPCQDGSVQCEPRPKRARLLASIIGFTFSEKALSWACRTLPEDTTTNMSNSTTSGYLRALNHHPEPIIVDLVSDHEGN